MTALDLLLQPWALDSRSFVAGALVCSIFVCGTLALFLLITFTRSH